jgi:hypothetical protein
MPKCPNSLSFILLLNTTGMTELNSLDKFISRSNSILLRTGMQNAKAYAS